MGLAKARADTPKRELAEDEFPSMRPVSTKEFLAFVGVGKEILIEGTEVELHGEPRRVIDSEPRPEGESYRPETFTVWSFPDRGTWATHKGNYRGNWSPYIPRNVILRYTQPGDLVLDQFLGSGTTMVEAKLLGRRGIGVDINRDAVMLAHDRLNFTVDETTKKEEDADEVVKRAGPAAAPQWGDLKPKPRAPARPTTSSSSHSSLSSSASSVALGDIQLYCGDARNLDAIKDETVDLIATHPPYAGIIKYTGDRVPGDLSAEKGIDGFLRGMRAAADESFRVLKPGKHCAVLIGDTRKHKHYVPIAFRTMQTFLDAGFVLREDIIKLQHNMKTTREKWRGSKYDFYLLAHEHLFVFRKLSLEESASEFRLSRKWW